MNLNKEFDNSTLTFFLEGEIDHHIAGALRQEIDSAILRLNPRKLVLDFKNVTFMDSSGIGLVMGRYKLIQELKGEVVVTNISSNTAKVMRLAGLDRLVRIERGGHKYETVK